MRSVDGIRSSKFGRAVLQPIRQHPATFLLAVSFGLVVIVFLVWTISFSVLTPVLNQSAAIPTKAVAAVAPSVVAAVPIAEPDHLAIPTIGLDASVEQVGLTKSGAMAVPANTNNVGWFKEGYQPGELGNAVITGHVDTLWLKPAVFAHIDQLTAGNLLTVTDVNGARYIFSVDQVIHYRLSELPLNEIYGASATAHLNLITCSGQWSWRIGSYTERTVVYTTLVPSPAT